MGKLEQGIKMLEAKLVVKNKFWVVEREGEQIATIQAAEDGVVLVNGDKREKFATIKLLSSKYNINLDKSNKSISPKSKHAFAVYDYPCDVKPFNAMYNIKLRLPLYTKTVKSKSFYCAGYYIIKDADTWSTAFCPKKILLVRHTRLGPFNTLDEAQRSIADK